jgi:hypothetical protein
MLSILHGFLLSSAVVGLGFLVIIANPQMLPI